MTLANNTPYAALAVPYVAPDGREIVIALVKATFLRDAERGAVLRQDQMPVRTGDVVHFADAEHSSIRYPSDIGTDKVGTDVVVVGEAVSATPVRALALVLTVGDHLVPLRVHGRRLFYSGALGLAVGKAASFQRLPLIYELAYGGTSEDFIQVEQRNPVGLGVANQSADLADRPAPSIEHPARPITSDAPSEPVGYGAIASHWQPRAGYAGTFDQSWRDTRMPLMPRDFDRRFNNVAHPSLQFAEGLAPGTRIAVGGMTPEGSWHVDLPPVPVVLRGSYEDGKVLEVRPQVDTVLIEPEQDRVELTLRHCFAKGRGKTLLQQVQVDRDD